AGGQEGLYLKQMIWIVISLTVFFVIVILPLRMHEALSYVYYFLLIVLLVALMFYGRQGGGSQRWFDLGFFHFQPSELGKVAVLFVLARYLSYSTKSSQHFRRLFFSALLVFIPTALVLQQPDLGTSLVYLTMMLAVLFFSGLPTVYLLLILAPAFSMITSFHPLSYVVLFALLIVILIILRPRAVMASAIVVINLVFGIITPFLWNRLAEYQQLRIKVFLNLEDDRLGAGYQIIQSKIAIGSGGLFGKGFLAGTQTNLNYLPVRHTDFVFSVMGEEFGFVGAVLIIILLGAIIFLGLRTAMRVRNKFASYVCIGAITILFFQTAVNIGMTLGLMPVTGLPLHFVSYGGSSMILSWLLLGLLVNAELNWQDY
ncbi:MAG: rod shape-determining protein RodA, partial [candidate division Zixibacteria bacterium]|nr:rod shape-determining protein RodA [candidate division Zixibacteria bacterium]NIR68309.1 rod shape-determining protein RodA [candidate division Zixibacteria bacterium]NIS18290.1 rod shape-determining protein RodA [candidate division Zixibacteria bacterium]NIS49476.1 rod shape-determining protein RodA [candidate division Zixibacteria bacterium]NIT54613.1 rod shape-determining protein RodA [candidate division Zixibacteria bacterium]